MKKNLFTISLVLLLCLTGTYNDVLAEEKLEPGKCSITIDKSKNTFSNRSQATGPCKGLVEGYYLDVPMLYGSYTGSVSNGQEVVIGTPKVPYGESRLTVQIIEGAPPAPPKETNEDKKPVNPAPKEKQESKDKNESTSKEKNKNSNTESKVKEKSSNNVSKSSTNSNSSSTTEKKNASQNNNDTVTDGNTSSINKSEKKENNETSTESKQAKDSSDETKGAVDKSKEYESKIEEKTEIEETEKNKIKTSAAKQSSTEDQEISNAEINESEPSSNLWIWIVMGLIAVITVILISILIYKKRKEE